MLLSGTQNELFDLLVTAIWWTKAPELLKLFKRSEEDEIPEVRAYEHIVSIPSWNVMLSLCKN